MGLENSSKRTSLESQNLCALPYAGGKFPSSLECLGKHFQNSEAWESESSALFDET